MDSGGICCARPTAAEWFSEEGVGLLAGLSNDGRRSLEPIRQSASLVALGSPLTANYFFKPVIIRCTGWQRTRTKKGSPCKIPLVGIIISVSIELKRTKYLTDETHDIINLTHRAAKPNLIIIFSKSPHSTLSYALCISSFSAHSPHFSLFLLMAWMHSYAMIMLPPTLLLIS
jgi:hypothetical protein